VKTQVIHLSQNEDAISVREKMSWSQARRILLVWPAHGQALNRKLDLNLVARKATSVGALLALVTRDPQVWFYAQQLEISVFDSLKNALDADWKSTRKIRIPHRAFQPDELIKLVQSIHPETARWVEQLATRIMCLSFSVLALFILGICLLPGAKIIISPSVQSQTMLFDISASPNTQPTGFSSLRLPNYTRQIVIEGHGTMTATGSVTIPDKAATGSVSFTNISNRTINIPIGTIISTLGNDPIRFITTSSGETSVNPDETVTLAARAIQTGPSGNLAAYKLSTVEGTLEKDLIVTNPAATSGGSLATAAAPTTQDMASLRQRLLAKLLQEAQVELQSTLPRNDLLITPTITNVETIIETFFPEAGQPGNQLDLTLKIRVQAQAISGKTLQASLGPIMDANTPQGYSSVSAISVITPLGTPTIGADGTVRLSIRAERMVRANIPAGRVAGLVTGKSMSQARANLSAHLPVSAPASIVLSPSWWPRLPFLVIRIQVIEMDGQ
jgi:hypothetical protein